MKQIFLGPLSHWVILVIAVALGWVAGESRLHVINFNLFLVLVIAGTVVALLAVIATARPGARISREPIEDADEPGDMPQATQTERTG